MHPHLFLRCLLAVELFLVGQIGASSITFPRRANGHLSHEAIPQLLEREQDTSSSFNSDPAAQTASQLTTTGAPQPETTDGPTVDSTTAIDDTSTSPSVPTRVSSGKPSSAAESDSSKSTDTTKTTKTTGLPSSSTLTASATSTPSPSPTATPFQMSAASIAATVILGCFVFGGLAIMLYYRSRRHRPFRARHPVSGRPSDADHLTRPKSYGESLAPSTISLRESMMYHPDHRDRGSVTAPSIGNRSSYISEQEPPYDYLYQHSGIPMTEVEANEETARSPVSPLIAPTFTRPVSSAGGSTARHSLRREYSFEQVQHSATVTGTRESFEVNRRSALTSHPAAGWPLVTPSIYSRGFSPRPQSDQVLLPAGDRRSRGWQSVSQRQSFEDVEIHAK